MKRLAMGVCLLSMAASAEAYVGPGMGLGVIAAIFGLLTAIFLALAGMVWYPVKRLIRGRRVPAPANAALASPPSADPASRGTEERPGA